MGVTQQYHISLLNFLMDQQVLTIVSTVLGYMKHNLWTGIYTYVRKCVREIGRSRKRGTERLLKSGESGRGGRRERREERELTTANSSASSCPSLSMSERFQIFPRASTGSLEANIMGLAFSPDSFPPTGPIPCVCVGGGGVCTQCIQAILLLC